MLASAVAGDKLYEGRLSGPAAPTSTNRLDLQTATRGSVRHRGRRVRKIMRDNLANLLELGS
jgi:hypothetical protein